MDPNEADKSNDNDWSNLKSIRTFDRPSDINTRNCSTEIVGGNLIETLTCKATTPVSLLVESLVQQLCTLLEPDPMEAKQLYTIICQYLHEINLIDSSYGMGEFELMRNRYQQALYQLVLVAQKPDLPKTLQTNWSLKQQPNALDWSRYHREFEELSYIAGGGFGQVYRARNCIDGTVYAIKKITIRSTNIVRVMSHFHEVKTMAKLHHINIVPYKAAWLEPLVSPSPTTNEDHNNTDINQPSVESNDSIDDQSFTTNDTSDFIEFKRSSSNSSNSQYSAQVKNAALCKYSLANKRLLEIDKDVPRLKLKWAVLYIQMALCQMTLREWLDQRNESDKCFEEFYRQYFNTQQSHNEQQKKLSERKQYVVRRPSSNIEYDISDDWTTHLNVTKNIMRQLFAGLEYIHSKGIIHHDIKPSNIFIGMEENRCQLTVQLGDFGLACPLDHKHTNVTAGTPSYAAPEQLNGTCNPKSDIYSLGIVLIELLLRFSTTMERSQTIILARKGQLTNEIPTNFHYLIKCMLQTNPKKRPDINDMVEQLDQISTLSENTLSSFTVKTSDQASLYSEIATSSTTSSSLLSTKSSCTSAEMQIAIKNAEIRMKDQQIEQLQNQIRAQNHEMVLKDKEINRLQSLLIAGNSKENTQ